MQSSEPIVIHKHWFGLFLIYLVGGGLFAGLFALGWYTHITEPRNALANVLFAVAVMVALIAAIQILVYRLANVGLDAVALTVENWSTIFSNTISVTEWNQVQDVQVKKPGLFSQLLGYGTLLIETAGDRPNLKFTWTPNVRQLQAVMAERAAEATTPVTDSAL